MKTQKLPTLKEWMADKATATGVSVTQVWKRLQIGYYPKVKLHRKSPRVIFVEEQP